jgi:hypothetical protein
MQWFIAQHGILSRLHLSSSEAHEQRLHALSGRLDRGTPLCGAADGPWSARSFDFSRLTCHECQSLVLTPEQTPG